MALAITSGHFSFIQHRLWLEGPEVLHRFNRYLKLLVLAVVVYGAGLAVAATTRIATVYLISPAFIAGAAGLAWVITSIAARARKVDLIYGAAIGMFSDPKAYIQSEIQRRFNVACSLLAHMITGAVISAGLLLAAAFSFFDPNAEVLGQRLHSLRPVWFSAELYEAKNLIPGFVLVCLFGIAIGMSLGTATWLIFAELNVVYFLSTLSAPPLPEAIRIKLRVVADFHAVVSRDWAIGAVLMGAMFAATPDVFSISFIAALTAIGLIVFVYPQVVFRSVISRAHGRAAQIVIEQWQRSGELRNDADLSRLADLTAVMAPPGYWVYGAGSIAMWLVAEFTAFFAVVAQIAKL